LIKLGIVVLASIVIFSPLLMNEAFAMINVTERMENYEMTQIANYTFVHKFGLSNYIANATGDFVPYLYTEDANGIELETGNLTYYFDKITCEMALHKSGVMTNPPLVANNDWVVRVAVNGTESYSDISQNDLPCTVIGTFLETTAQINSTKSDANGSISEVYNFNAEDGLKHDLFFTNTNPSWNDHKFAWTNIMLDVPPSFTIGRTSEPIGEIFGDMYSVFSGANQPSKLNGDATVLNYAVGETIEYLASDFIFNGTEYIGGFTLHVENDDDVINYNWKDGINLLSSVQFVSNPDQTLDLFVNYQNVTQPLPINSTMNLDPVVSTQGFGDNTLSFGFASHCGRNSATAFVATTLGTARLSKSGGSATCSGTYAHFDISSIPDVATPTTIRLFINVTGGSVSGTGALSNICCQIFGIFDEDISNFSLVQLAQVLRTPSLSAGSLCGGGLNCVAKSPAYGNFGNLGQNPQNFPFLRGQTFTLPTQPIIIDFELQLESGKNFFDFVVCPFISSGSPSGRGGCAGAVGIPASNTNGMNWDLTSSDTFFEVTFEVFTVPSAVTSLTATHSPSPDKCLVDWGIVGDDGGKPVSGYLIERNVNGGSFTTLVASSPIVPTDHSDTTIVSGESYFYRVSAINSEGTGTSTTTPLSCGIPSIADAPSLLNVFEEPTGDITLSWIPNFDGAIPTLGYKIERSVNSGSFTTIVASTGNANTSFIDGTAGLNILNTYRVSLINSLGTSPASNQLGFTIVVAGGGAGAGAGDGSPVPPITEDEDLLTQQEFDLALELALSQIEIQELTIIETVVRTFFEFAVVDTTLDDLPLNSFLQNERLGIRWSSGQDIVVVGAVPAVSPFLITFEQFPVVKQGSGAVVSTDFLMYNLQVPRNECTDVVRSNCALKVRYEVPITVNAILNGTNVSDTGTITVDLREGEIDPILLIILATFGIPIIGGIVQRSRKRSTQVPIGRLISG